MKLHVKKGDTVVILSGNEKGKEGKVTGVFPKTGMVLVEGAGMRVKHQKPRRSGQTGQIVEKQQPMRASKVMEAGRYKERKNRKAAPKKK